MKCPQRIGVVVLALLLAGCAKPGLQRGADANLPAQPFETTGLAGEWEVSDGTVERTIVLDCRGVGLYGWQGGIVTTSVVRGDYWAGTWYQSGNDREGGFEVHISPDRFTAEGRWWYTRIGKEHFVPGEKGDTFNMSRPMRAMQAQDRCPTNKAIHEARGAY